MEQKIVVHLRAGAIHKGVTQDFSPRHESFHLLSGEGGGVPVKIRLADMKAMFWVKDYLGNRDFVARRDFDPKKKPPGKRAIVTFHDGETIWGTVTEDEPEVPGFFFLPADEADNNIKIFVIRASVKELRWAP
ncbi:MAG TPA: hypothetical protein VMR65_11065 [Candidatus Sulfotelmatobacter sp.]|jgi:hypothetical protein|nr:hypothetical protein [Candidatus Sulfotelmatobacter sp.]